MCGVFLGRGAGSTTEAAAQETTEYRQEAVGVGRGVIRLQRQQDAATIKLRVDVAQRSYLGAFIPRHFSSSLLVRVPNRNMNVPQPMAIRSIRRTEWVHPRQVGETMPLLNLKSTSTARLVTKSRHSQFEHLVYK